MTEIEQIINNNNGETPAGKFDKLIVTDIANPRDVLENFKSSVISILSNADISKEDKKWESLLPKNILYSISKFDEEFLICLQ
jgi:glutamyl-tRNA reductase